MRPVLGGVAVAVVLGAVAVQGGLWWAGWEEPDALAVSASATSVLQGPPGAAPTDGSDWLGILRELDSARSEALRVADPALLDAVYAPGSPARPADDALISRLLSAGLRVDGGAHEIEAVELLADPSAGSTARLRLVDSLPAYPLIDRTGAVVGQTSARARAVRIVSVTDTPSGYRIEQMQSEPG